MQTNDQCPLAHAFGQLKAEMSVVEARIVCERNGLEENSQAENPNFAYECQSASIISGGRKPCGILVFSEQNLP